MDQQENGQKFCVRVFDTINAHDKNVQNNTELMRFKYSINNDQYESILGYNDIVQRIYDDQESDIV